MSEQSPEPSGSDPFSALPPELAEILRQLTSTNADPAMQQMLGQFGIDKLDPATLAVIGQQVNALMNASDEGAIDLANATDLARKTVAAAGDELVSAPRQHAVDQALAVARLWLDAVTEFAAHDIEEGAWSRAEWVEATMTTWASLVEPIAEGVTAAMTAAMTAQLEQFDQLTEGGIPEGLLPDGVLPAGMDPRAMLGAIQPMVARMGSAMFSMQLGQAVGTLAGDVLSGTDVGLPLVPTRTVAMVPVNIDAFASGLDIDAEEVLLYLAVRESARARLFAAVPWLGPGVTAAVRDYASDIRIDTEGIERTLSDIDLSDPGAMVAVQEKLQGQLFTPQPSPAQQAALTRLETLLALVEGWVDVVTDRATRSTLPHAAALGEVIRRRRGTGGPAEKTFASLVGLQLRPRRLRDAANLWAALEDRLGADRRDDAWRHPDLAPTGADLDDVLGYVDRVQGGSTPDEFDSALNALLDAEDRSDPGEGSAG
ncbi:MAG: zinc-dependent metalloprotease [Nostocoides sp.]